MGNFPPIAVPLRDAVPEGPDRITRGDIRSANWDGAGDLPALDTAATQGYLIDYSTGSAQFQNLFSEGGAIGDLLITGALTIGTDGVIRSAESGARYELKVSGTLVGFRFYSDFGGETSPGWLAYNDTSNIMELFTPFVSGAYTELNITGNPLVIDGDTQADLLATTIDIGYSGGSSTTTLRGGVLLPADTTVTQEAVTNPSLQNSWVNFGSGEMPIQYHKDSDGIVHCSGVLKSGTTTSGTLIFTFDAGYRPVGNFHGTGVGNNLFASFKVVTNGQLIARTGWSATFTSINFSFPTN